MARRSLRLSAFRLLTLSNQRLTPSGRLVALGAGCAGLFSVDASRTQAFQIFSLFCGLLVVSFLFSLRFRGRFVVERETLRHATIGQSVQYGVSVSHRQPTHQDDLVILEAPSAAPPTRQEFLTMREPGEAKRNWFDRRVAAHRYLWITRYKQGFIGKPTSLPRIPAAGRCRVTLSITPHRRGRITLPGPSLLKPDPLGLIYAIQSHSQPATLLVLPKRYPLAAGFAMPGSRRHQPGGVNMASCVGEAEEFVSIREYREGDSPRHIYWPGFARYDKLLVKEYQEEYFTRYGLIMDTFAPVGQNREIFEEAVSLAASFSTVVESGDVLLELLFVGTQAYHFTAGRGVAHAEQLLEILACVEPNTEEDFRRLTELVLGQSMTLSGCIIVLLAWDEPRQQLVRKLAPLHLPLLVLVVTADPTVTLAPVVLGHPSSRLQGVPLGQGAEILARLAL